MLGVFRRTDVDAGNAHTLSSCGSAGAGLVVVVDDVDIHALAAIAAIATPVVDDVVAQIHALVSLGAGTRTQTGCTAGVMNHEVVMIGCSAPTPVAAIAVTALGVARIHQALRGDAPLHGDILRAIDGEALVDGPADGTVIDNDILSVHSTQAVALVGIRVGFQSLVAQTETDITDYDILVQCHGIVG